MTVITAGARGGNNMTPEELISENEIRIRFSLWYAQAPEVEKSIKLIQAIGEFYEIGPAGIAAMLKAFDGLATICFAAGGECGVEMYQELQTIIGKGKT